MRLEYISKVKENDVLGKNVYTNDGKILLRAGVKLSDLYIKRLNELGVYYVYLEDVRLDDVEVEDEKLTLLKQQTMQSLREISRGVGIVESSKRYLQTVDELIDYIVEINDVNKSLTDIRTHDNYTFIHSVNTGVMAVFFGMTLGMKRQSLTELAIGGMLHDIGKIKIATSVINKEGPLTDEEFNEMRKHPIYGRKLLEKNVNIPSTSILAIEQHHEKINGKGYPYGLRGEEISTFGKITGICDVYDAVNSNRSYRKKFNPNEAYELILSGCGIDFDNKLVNIFRNTFSVYSLGSCVKLSNGVEGYVIRQNSRFPDRPVIRVLYDHETRKPTKFYEIDLLKHLNLIVQEVI